LCNQNGAVLKLSCEMGGISKSTIFEPKNSLSIKTRLLVGVLLQQQEGNPKRLNIVFNVGAGLTLYGQTVTRPM
jgi:hypothetical protein